MAERTIKTEGLTLKELEAQATGLLPDRVEMRRRRRPLRRRRSSSGFMFVMVQDDHHGGSGPG